MRRLNLWHNDEDGYSVEVLDVSWYRAAVGQVWEWGCWLTRGVLGGHGMPGWAWNIPVGIPKKDEYGLVNSLPDFLQNLEAKALFWEREQRDYAFRKHISRDEAFALDPDFVRRIEGEIDGG